MSTPREKVLALMARALSPSTPVEEARTSAMTALQLIDKYKLLEQNHEAPRAPPPPRPAPPPRRPVPQPTPVRPRPHHVRVTFVDIGTRVGAQDSFPDFDPVFFEDIFGDARPPEHEVASTKHYPTHRVLNEVMKCASCGQPTHVNSLVVIDLDMSGREVIFHRPCWDRITNG